VAVDSWEVERRFGERVLADGRANAHRTKWSALAENGTVRRFQSRHWGWWYLSIGLGFLLLAIVYRLQGGTRTDIWLRIGVATGFAILGWIQLRYGR
jgi:hypothetical protein